MHEEGTDHIKEQVENRQQGSEGTGAFHQPQPITQIEPPASNPGSDDPSGGMATDAGGLSGTAHVGSPVSNPDMTTSIVDTVKGFLGLSVQEKDAAEWTTAGTADVAVAPGAGTAAVATAASGTGLAASTVAFASTVGQSSSTQDSMSGSAKPVSDPSPSTSSPNQRSTEADRASAGTATSSDMPGSKQPAVDPAPQGKTDDSVSKDADQKATEGQSKEEKEAKAKAPTNAGGKPMENKDAIPTAGGERLGEKHWGESKIVPDNPKPQGEGVSSAEGQPDSMFLPFLL